jgi:hypothetical protein
MSQSLENLGDNQTMPSDKEKLKSSLSYPGRDKREKPKIHDLIQVALSTADKNKLAELLQKCEPPIIRHGFIGDIYSEVEVPVDRSKSADGVIRFYDLSDTVRKCM